MKVLVERGIRRKTSNELFSVLKRFNVGSCPCDLRKASGTAREVPVKDVSGLVSLFRFSEFTLSSVNVF